MIEQKKSLADVFADIDRLASKVTVLATAVAKHAKQGGLKAEEVGFLHRLATILTDYGFQFKNISAAPTQRWRIPTAR